MMNIKNKISIFAFLLLCCNLAAQETGLAGKTQTHTIHSQDNDKYVLKITFPSNYSPNKEYKTLYYLDAYWLSEITLGSYTILDLTDYVEDVVFIGISNGSESENEWHKQRDMDFTPSPFKNLGIFEDFKKKNPDIEIEISAKAVGGNHLTEQNTGGAALFLDFLENDVIQFVESNHPNLNKRRGLLGHSFGGLFGFYALQNRPEIFKDFILISASLSWNSFELVAENKFSALAASNNQMKLYHSYGGNEIAAIKNSNTEIKNILVELGSRNLNYRFEPFEETNHHSILSRAIYDGLLFLYKK